MSSQEQLKEPGARKKAGAKIICSIQIILDSEPLLDLTKQKMNLARTVTLAFILSLPFATFLTSNCMNKGRGHGCS